MAAVVSHVCKLLSSVSTEGADYIGVECQVQSACYVTVAAHRFRMNSFHTKQKSPLIHTYERVMTFKILSHGMKSSPCHAVGTYRDCLYTSTNPCSRMFLSHSLMNCRRSRINLALTMTQPC